LGYINYGRYVNINPYDPYMYVGSGGIYYSYTIIPLNSKVPDESLEDVNTLYEEILKLLNEAVEIETRLKEKL
jgi:predicted transcriptional regulator